MASEHEEKIAVYLQAAGANSTKGVSADELTLACSLPDKVAYRILRNGRGFYKSNFPRRPQGWYFDMDKAVAQMLGNTQTLSAMAAVTDKADATLKQATYLESKMTDVGRILSQTNIDGGNEDIIKIINDIKAPKSYTIQEMKDNIKRATNVKELGTWLVLCLVAFNRNLIVADIDITKEASASIINIPTAVASEPIVESEESLAMNKWRLVYKHHGLKGADWFILSDTEKQELTDKYDKEIG